MIAARAGLRIPDAGSWAQVVSVLDPWSCGSIGPSWSLAGIIGELRVSKLNVLWLGAGGRVFRSGVNCRRPDISAPVLCSLALRQ